ncbi:MAG TPA: disulfide bond formation protein B [Burkholderiales bacterium]|jgi:disulfide bond formation protein DsbB|nr:disulfide bond formation protein B [Burkholderiales bacterium]
MMNSRLVYTGMFLVCSGLIGFGLYLQHTQGLEPCPMCILQRYAFIAIGVIALAAAIHNPVTTGRRVYSTLLLIFAGLGGGVATRHVWLEHNPPKVFDCGADLGYMIESLPLADALPMIFRGTGDCTKVLWRFLGLSIAEWALIWFAIFLVAAIVAAAMKPKRLRMFGP